MSKYEHQLQPGKITTGKKGTVVWPAMFFEPPEKITAGKKRYSHLANGWNKSQNSYWFFFILLVVVSVCVVFCVLCCLQNNPVFSSVTISHILKNENYELCFLAGFFVDQITTGNNYDRKKRYSRLAVGWNKSQITVCRAKIRTPTITGKNYDRKNKVQLSGRR